MCGVDDTPQHVFYDCLRYNEDRYGLVTELVERGISFDMKRALREAESFSIMKKWSVDIEHRREDELV